MAAWQSQKEETTVAEDTDMEEINDKTKEDVDIPKEEEVVNSKTQEKDLESQTQPGKNK